MPRLVAIALEPSALDVVASLAAEARLRLDVRDGNTGVDLPSGDLAAANEIEMIVLGDVGEPLRVIRRCQAALPRVPVVFVASERRCHALLDAVRFSPFGARELECVHRERPEQLRARIRDALDVRRRRQALRHTFDALNQRLGARAVAPRQAAALLGRLLDVAPIGVVIADDDGVLREANARAAELLGGADVDVTGRPFAELFIANDTPRVRALLADVHRTPDAAPRIIASVPSAAGRSNQLELTGSRLGVDDGGPGYLLVLQDATERHELLTELVAANRAKDQFIAMLGHELRNPLAPVRTAVDLLRLRRDPTIERECTTIDRHVTHLTRLVDDLLDITRITQGKLQLHREHVELHAVIAQALEMVSPLLEQQRHAIDIDVPRIGLPVFADRSRLAQVFANLLANAAKYTDAGGRIAITATRVDATIRTSVRDNGRGIAPEMLPHVFELFVQEHQSLERSHGGLGLGLAIVRSLVTMHDGTITASSELGRGSEFVVSLPASEPAARVATPRPHVAMAGASARVLIVDDNVDAAELLAELLQTLGYATRTAPDGPTALAVADSFDPEIILLDIGLPVMDGYEVAARLQTTRHASARIIGISGYGQDEDRARSQRAGFAEHLTKPVDIAGLVTALQRVRATS